MTHAAQRRIVIGITAGLIVLLTFVAFQYSGRERATVVLLIVATTLLTISSVAGLAFIGFFANIALGARKNLRDRGLALLLAAISFGVSYGSGALLGWLLSRA